MVSSLGGTFWAVSRVGGILLAALKVGRTFWRYLELAVLFVTKAVKPKYGGICLAAMQYGGNVLAVGGFSFFAGNTWAVGCITKI